jgi:hypothetical protein
MTISPDHRLILRFICRLRARFKKTQFLLAWLDHLPVMLLEVTSENELLGYINGDNRKFTAAQILKLSLEKPPAALRVKLPSNEDKYIDWLDKAEAKSSKVKIAT